MRLITKPKPFGETMLKRLIIAAILAVALLAPAFASSTASGVVNWVKVHGDDGTYDTKTCIQFQIGNSATISATTGTYAIDTADANYEDEVSTVMLAYLTGQTLSFIDQGATDSNCTSSERADNPWLGTLY